MHKKQSDLGRFSDPSYIAQFCGTKLEPGTLYAALARLERRGWIEALEAEDRRRPYRITAVGEVALREQLKTLHQIVSVGQQRLALP